MTDHETTADEALLNAYLDGALPPDEMREFEARLAADARLADRLGALRSADERLRKEARRIDGEPMSASLSALISQLKAEIAAGEPAVVSFPFLRRGVRFVAEHRAIAASLAALAGAFMLQVVLSDSPSMWSRDGRILASSDVGRALDARLSGDPAMLRTGARFSARMSFRSRNGEFCRVFEILGAGADSQNVACRDDRGWRLALVSSPSAASERPAGVYTTASAASNPVLEAYLDDAMEGEPMGREAEAEAIANGWGD